MKISKHVAFVVRALHPTLRRVSIEFLLRRYAGLASSIGLHARIASQVFAREIERRNRAERVILDKLARNWREGSAS